MVRAQPADPWCRESGCGRPGGGVTVWPRGLAAVGWVDQSGFSSEAEPGCVYIKRLIVRNWLLQPGAGKSEIRRAGQQPGSSGSSLLNSFFPPNLRFARQARAGLEEAHRCCGGYWPPFKARRLQILTTSTKFLLSNPQLGVRLHGWLQSLDKLTHDTHYHRGKVDAQAREVSRPGDLLEAGGKFPARESPGPLLGRSSQRIQHSPP